MTYYYKSKKQFPVELIYQDKFVVLVRYDQDGQTINKTFDVEYFNANFAQSYDVVKAWNTANNIINDVNQAIDDLKPNVAKNKLTQLQSVLINIYNDLPKEWQDVELKEQKTEK